MATKEIRINSDKSRSGATTTFELFHLVNEEYKCTASSMNEIRKKVNDDNIFRLILDNDEFLMLAANEMSYSSLAFIINLDLVPRLRDKFRKDSKILKTFIFKMSSRKVGGSDGPQIKKVLLALMWINEEAVKDAILSSKNQALIKLLLDVVSEFDKCDSSIFLEDDMEFATDPSISQLFQLVHSEYKCTASSMDKILEKLKGDKIDRLLLDNDGFLMLAAKEMSYNSLAFIINLHLSPLVGDQFNKNPEILKTFIRKMSSRNVDGSDDPEIKKVLSALIWINEEAIKDAILSSKNQALIRLLLDVVNTLDKCDSSIFLEEDDTDFDTDSSIQKIRIDKSKEKGIDGNTKFKSLEQMIDANMPAQIDYCSKFHEKQMEILLGVAKSTKTEGPEFMKYLTRLGENK